MKGLPRYLSRGPQTKQEIVKLAIPINAPITFTGSTGVAVGGTAVLRGLPQGNILLLGAVAYVQFSGPTSANLANDFQGDFSVGTNPTADNDLSDTDEANIIASTQIPAATNEVTSLIRATNATQAILDNTDGSMELNLNVLLDADEVTDGQDVVVTAEGVLHIAYIVMGDD